MAHNDLKGIRNTRLTPARSQVWKECGFKSHPLEVWASDAENAPDGVERRAGIRKESWGR